MAIFVIHHPLVFTFGVLGNIVSIIGYLSPLPTFMEIHKRKSTSGFQSLPYVVALFSAMLWMYYAFLKSDAVLLISINSFGCLIETIYIVIYLVYASKESRNHTAKLLASLNVGFFTAILLVTLFLVNGSHRVLVVGWVCVAISVSVFAAPLSIMFEVVRTRSVEFMPFPLSFFLTLTAIMWFAYGLLLKDLCIALPNIFGFFLGMLQMVLYGMYRNCKEVVKEKKVAEHIINIVVLGSPAVDARNKKKSGSDINDGPKDDQLQNQHKQIHDNYEKIASSAPVQPSQPKANVPLDSPPPLVTCTA